MLAAAHTYSYTHRTIRCNTSGASPTFSEIDETVSRFRGKEWAYLQKNRLSSSLCTTLISVRGADVGMCGVPGQYTAASQIAKALVYVMSSLPSVCVMTEIFAGTARLRKSVPTTQLAGLAGNISLMRHSGWNCFDFGVLRATLKDSSRANGICIQTM